MIKLFQKKQPASAPVLPSWDPFFELRERLKAARLNTDSPELEEVLITQLAVKASARA